MVLVATQLAIFYARSIRFLRMLMSCCLYLNRRSSASWHKRSHLLKLVGILKGLCRGVLAHSASFSKRAHVQHNSSLVHSGRLPSVLAFWDVYPDDELTSFVRYVVARLRLRGVQGRLFWDDIVYNRSKVFF